MVLECVFDVGDVLSELTVKRYINRHAKDKPHLPMVIISFFDRVYVALASLTHVMQHVYAVVEQRLGDIPTGVYLSIRKDKEELITNIRGMAAGGTALESTNLWESSKGRSLLPKRSICLTHSSPALSLSQSRT